MVCPRGPWRRSARIAAARAVVHRSSGGRAMGYRPAHATRATAGRPVVQPGVSEAIGLMQQVDSLAVDRGRLLNDRVLSAPTPALPGSGQAGAAADFSGRVRGGVFLGLTFFGCLVVVSSTVRRKRTVSLNGMKK